MNTHVIKVCDVYFESIESGYETSIVRLTVQECKFSVGDNVEFFDAIKKRNLFARVINVYNFGTTGDYVNIKFKVLS